MKLHRLVFSLRHSKEERIDLDWEEEERGRNARREAEENKRAVTDEEQSKMSSYFKEFAMIIFVTVTTDIYLNTVFFAIDEGGERSIIRKIIGWFCGTNDTQAPEPTEEEYAKASKQLPDISENPLWRNMVNANALIMMSVAVFCWGFYA